MLWAVLLILALVVLTNFDRHIARSLANSRFLSPVLIRAYKARYSITIDTSEYNDECMDTLQNFFNRRFKNIDKHRPLATGVFMSSPCDGSVTRCMASSDVKVKGSPLVNVSRCEAASNMGLAGDNKTLVIYLAPSDYHRTYWPCDGEIISIRSAGGRGMLVAGAVDPFAYRENYRLYYQLVTARGTITCVLVGSIYINSVDSLNHQVGQTIKRGEPMANFEIGGSTVVIFIDKSLSFDDVESTAKARSSILMGD